MSVTVFNNTNSPINVCVSAAVNYDWRNRVSPGEYVVMDKFGVGTLSTRWWFGESTEYAVSGIEIGFFVGGTVLGIVGLCLAPFSGGTSLALTVAGVALTGGQVAAAGFAVGVAGSVVGGVAFAAKDFFNTPASVTGVGVLSNLIYSVDGKVGFGKLEHGILNNTDPGPLKLRPLSPVEFQELKARPKGIASEVAPVESAYVVARELVNCGHWIYPSYCGVPALSPACWQASTEGAGDHPVRLHSEKGLEAEWFIIPVKELKAYKPEPGFAGKNFDAYAYNIYNPFLDVFASVSRDPSDGRILTKKHASGPQSLPGASNQDPYTLFFIIQTANCYTFVPVSRNSRSADSVHLGAVVNEEGALGNGTAVVAGQRTGSYPGRARWVVERIDLEPTKDDSTNGDGADYLEQLLGCELLKSRFRIVPALLEGNRLQSDFHPGWQSNAGDYDYWSGRQYPIVLGSGDNASTEWEIRFKRKGDLGDLFTISQLGTKKDSNQRLYAHPGGGGFINSTSGEALFYIKHSMGFFSIRSERVFFVGNGLYAENLSPGAGIRMGGGTGWHRSGTGIPRSEYAVRVPLSKWAIVPVGKTGA